MLRFYSNVSAIRRRHLQTLQMGGEVEYHEEQPRPGDGLSCWPLLGDDAFARSNWPQLHSWTWIAAAGSKEAVIPSCCDRLVRRMFLSSFARAAAFSASNFAPWTLVGKSLMTCCTSTSRSFGSFGLIVCCLGTTDPEPDPDFKASFLRNKTWPLESIYVSYPCWSRTSFGTTPLVSNSRMSSWFSRLPSNKNRKHMIACSLI